MKPPKRTSLPSRDPRHRKNPRLREVAEQIIEERSSIFEDLAWRRHPKAVGKPPVQAFIIPLTWATCG